MGNIFRSIVNFIKFRGYNVIFQLHWKNQEFLEKPNNIVGDVIPPNVVCYLQHENCIVNEGLHSIYANKYIQDACLSRQNIKKNIVINITESTSLSKYIYKNKGLKLKRKLIILDEYLIEIRNGIVKNIIELNCEDNVVTRHLLDENNGKFEFDNKFCSYKIRELENICSKNYIVKHISTKIYPEIKAMLEKSGYSYNMSITQEEGLLIRSTITWKTRKFRTIVKCMIVFNITCREYLSKKYIYGSEISLEAEKRFNSLKSHPV